MADERKEYTVTVGGIEHTMLLDPQTAHRLYGDRAVPKPPAKVPTKAKTPANKSRTPATKDEG